MKPDDQIIGLVVCYLFLEAMKYLINRFAKTSQLTIEEQYILKELHNMHSVKDENGRPIWYMPKTIGDQQEKIIRLLDDISVVQRDTCHILERIIDKLDK